MWKHWLGVCKNCRKIENTPCRWFLTKRYNVVCGFYTISKNDTITYTNIHISETFCDGYSCRPIIQLPYYAFDWIHNSLSYDRGIKLLSCWTSSIIKCLQQCPLTHSGKHESSKIYKFFGKVSVNVPLCFHLSLMYPQKFDACSNLDSMILQFK